jgi:hypothetical protein
VEVAAGGLGGGAGGGLRAWVEEEVAPVGSQARVEAAAGGL